MKSLVFAAILVSFGAVVICQSHNYFWGYKGPYDVKTLDLVYPLKGQLGRNISAINITDQYINGKGGYASLLAGGIGYNHTTIHLKSQRGNGFSFIVEIYGR
ncbi:hypothetical protein RP20_CCG016987 [Aedes albopictus]|nr:hypothetical protein RP20_CCG016987 [Aedes albopictus]